MEHFINSYLICLSVITIIFLAGWIAQLKANAGWISDLLWAVSFPLQCYIYSFACDGYAGRKIVVLFLMILWGARMSVYLIKRNMHQQLDNRYFKVKGLSPKNKNFKILLIFIFQGFISTLVAYPFYIIGQNPNTRFSSGEYIGIGLLLISIILQSISDHQLQTFRSDIKNENKVLRTGLWKYSRHPNYFFEWMVWVSLCIIAINGPYGIAAIISPAIMLHLLLNVTGILIAEEQIVAAKGKDYRIYQMTTSSFVPWFRRSIRKVS